MSGRMNAYTTALFAKLDDPANVYIYLKQIDKIPLLTPEREQGLGKKILQAADERDRARLAGDQPDQQILEEGDEAKVALIEANLRLAANIAKKHAFNVPLLDLIQEGNLGLIEAANRFDYRKGRFSTYATPWIKKYVLAALDAHTARRDGPLD